MELRTMESPTICPLVVLTTVVVGAAVMWSALPDAEARVAMNQQTEVTYTCETPIEAAQSVQIAYAEHYECVEPIVSQWFEKHPEQIRRLGEQYDVWKKSRSHDLRDRREAGRFVRRNPVDFDTRQVSLTDRQVDALAPNSSAEPAQIAGAFQRFFVDRAAERLFLSTDEEGMVSVDISTRYQFDVQGAMGSAGGEDFFVVDENTALMEEDNSTHSARDLVVLDISDRGEPREIHRLVGVIPEASRPNRHLTAIPDRPPTFEEYRSIREGHLAPRECGNPPTVSTHADQRCRPDGSCVRVEHRSNPSEEGYCERSITAVARQLRFRGPVRGGGGGRVAPDVDSLASGEATSAPRPEPAPAAPVDEMEMGAEVAEAVEAPRGGEGGAGSLSQMMVHDSTLFVLSADHTLDRGWLTSFDISEVRRPQLTHLIALDNGPEALQRHDDLLLVAGRDALVTASAAGSDGPRLLGERRQRCPVNFDPVVVEGSIAYRTIIVDQPRSTCNSRLEVIDLSQPHQPQLRTTERIDRPRGLAVMDERLFVAEERKGVQVFDITDPVSPSHTTTWRLPGVKDLVLSDFDLYAMTPDAIETYYVGPLYGDEKATDGIYSQTTVKRQVR